MKIHTIKQSGIACLLATSLMLTACASIVHGDDEKFTVTSNPKYATLTVDNAKVGKTPQQIDLARKESHLLKVSLPGYQPNTIRLKRTVSGWMFGNFFLGGIIGIAIDATDGAMYNLTPEQTYQQSMNAGMRYTPKSHTITVFLVKKANKHWQKIGQFRFLFHWYFR